MKKTQWKDVVRNIRTNVVSWLAVVIVVTITCGVYCGVFFYADALEDTAAEFFENTNFEDLTVTAASGLTAEDIRALRDVSGVTDTEGTYRLSGSVLRVNGKSYTAEIQAVTNRISVPITTEGRLPDSGLECALTKDTMERLGLSVGEKVELKPGGSMGFSFTVTGVAEHPDAYYLGETERVVVPAATMQMLLGGNRYPVVLVKTDCGGSLLSDDYLEELAPVRTSVREAVEELLDSRSGEPAGFTVTTRMDHEGFLVLRQVVDILRKLATIFVVIFLGIGAIVVMSTVTVVIDGQKRQIGFLKAYGFRNREIIRRYLVYGESAVLVGMVCTVAVAFVLQYIMRRVLGGMFCQERSEFAFRLGAYLLLMLVEAVLIGSVAAWVTVSNASQYSAVELLSWNGKIPDHSGTRRRERAESAGRGTLYSRLIYRNIRSDQARVAASVIIIAGCCFMIGIGLTLNTAYHSMTKNTRREVACYDVECAVGEERDLARVEEALRGAGAQIARAVKAQTIYRYGDQEEYVTVVAAPAEVYQDYICLLGDDGKTVPVPETGCVLIQNRISERLGAGAGDELVIFDGTLEPHPVTVSGTARNYVGRVLYVSEETFAELFGAGAGTHTLLVRTGDADRETLTDLLAERFADVEISWPDAMPSMFSGLTDAFNALIYVLITLSIIMSVFVLLNLVNTFVSRRKNELIVMGVNGFSYREEIGYLLRETVATTVAGLVLGVLFGALVTRPLVHVIEASDTMCARSVNWPAWAAGVGLEAAFALCINLFAFRKVKDYGINDLK